MTSEMKAEIQREVKKTINVILQAFGQNATTNPNLGPVEDTYNCYPGMAVNAQRPSMKPYGFNSRAPNNTAQITARLGNDPTNRVVLGHRDIQAPNPPNEGETIVYSVGQFQLYVSNGALSVGKDGVWESVPMGEVLLNFLTSFLNIFISHTHGFDVGMQTVLIPDAQTIMNTETLQQNNLTNKYILCQNGGRF